MKDLHKHWKSIFARGIISIIFGLIALFLPALGFELLVLYFGAFALIDGLIAFLVGLHANSAILIFEGIVGIIIGTYIFFFTVQALVIFLVLVAVWAMGSGILEIIAGVELRRHIKDEIWLLFVGVVSIIFGFFVFINPIISALAITFVIGIYAIIFGTFLTALAYRVKGNKPSSKRVASKKSHTKKKR